MWNCPKCGAANQAENLACARCGYELAARAALRSGALTPGEEVIPDWLANLQKHLPEELRDPELDRMAKKQAIAAHPAATPSGRPEEKVDAIKGVPQQAVQPQVGPAPGTPEESDDWLNSLLTSMRAEASATVAAQTPMEETTVPAQTTEASPEQGSDWLSSFRRSMDLQSTTTEAPAQEGSALPDWLLAGGSALAVNNAVQATTPPAASAMPAQGLEPPKRGDEPEPMPGWLQSLEGGVPQPDFDEADVAPEPAPTLSIPVPEWLQEAAAPQTPGEPAPGAIPVPDWLTGEEAARTVEPTRPAAETTPSGWPGSDAAADTVVGAVAGIGLSRVGGQLPPGEPSRIDEPTVPMEAVGPAKAPAEPPVSQTSDWLTSFREQYMTPAEEAPEAPEAVEAGEGAEVEAALTGWLARASQQPVPPPEKAEPLKSPEPRTTGELPLAAVGLTLAASRLESEKPAGMPQPASEVSSTGEEEMPEWLQDIMSQSVDRDQAIMPDEATLRSLGIEKDATIPAPRVSPGESPAEGEGTPTWLSAMRDQQPGEEMEPPTWLTGPEAGGPAEGAAEELPKIQEETPGWLAGAAAVSTVGAAAEMPQWMSDLGRPKETTEQPAEPEGPVGVPDWLKRMGEYEVASGTLSAIGLPPETPMAEGEAPSQIALIPQEPLPAGAAVALPGTTVPISTQDPAGAVEVSGWTPRRQPSTVQIKAGEVLAGIGGLLVADAALSTLKAKESPLPQAVPEVTEQARVFQDIVGQPLLTKASTAAKRRSRFWPWLGRVVIYLLVIAAVLIPLYLQLVENAGFFNEYNLPVSARTQALYNQINSLPAQTPVLVVFDYDPSLAEELNAQARALLQHLMLRKADILLVSTSLTGPEIAQSLMDKLAVQPQYGYTYGQNYLNLGYLPGQESSLLLFGQDPLAAVKVDFRDRRPIKDQPIAAGLRDVPTNGLGKVVPLIISLSGTQEGLRSWLEQVGAQARNVRVVAGVSAGIEPYAQPYLSSGQLSGLMSGLPGAAEYEALLQIPGLAVRGFDSLAAVGLLIIGLIVLGNLAHVLKRLFRRR